MHLGEIEVRQIYGGIFYLDGGSMFGVVPKTLWEKKMPADQRNRIPLAANSLLVRANGKNILVETGNGSEMGREVAKHLWICRRRSLWRFPGRRPV